MGGEKKGKKEEEGVGGEKEGEWRRGSKVGVR
jgi:hypothetical protein